MKNVKHKIVKAVESMNSISTLAASTQLGLRMLKQRIGHKQQAVIFDDENVLSTATGRRYNNTTSAKHETHTFKLAMNKCNSEPEGQVVAGRESSNIIDDDSAHN